jgi:hypothetical protein
MEKNLGDQIPINKMLNVEKKIKDKEIEIKRIMTSFERK